MTNEQINAAIAIECGWTQVEAVHRSGRAPNADYVGNEFIPNYCNDLNAMHEVETYAGLDLQKYGNALRDSITPSGYVDYCKDHIWHCSARQRAEAFLRTLGKWKETK